MMRAVDFGASDTNISISMSPLTVVRTTTGPAGVAPRFWAPGDMACVEDSRPRTATASRERRIIHLRRVVGQRILLHGRRATDTARTRRGGPAREIRGRGRTGGRL